MSDSGGVKKRGRGRPPGSSGPRATGQLAAVRKAFELPAGSVSADPEVDTYLRLKEEDLKALVALRERLEREHAARHAARGSGGGQSSPPGPVQAGDGYERGEDAVTPKLEKLIGEWLTAVRARVDAAP